MDVTKTIIEWTWIHYRIKINQQDALRILLKFVNRLVGDESRFEDLRGCMKESMEDYLSIAEPLDNIHSN